MFPLNVSLTIANAAQLRLLATLLLSEGAPALTPAKVDAPAPIKAAPAGNDGATPAAAKPAAPAEAAPAAAKATRQDVGKAIIALGKVKGRNACVEVLKKFNASRGDEVPEKDWAACIAACTEAAKS